MELLTVKNLTMQSVPDPIAPLINPEGERPSGSALSPANAAMGATAEATSQGAQIGVAKPGAKNLVFLVIVGVLIYKYGKGLLNA